jgi:hypothetical protein
MLLTDGNPNNKLDLQAYESAILNVASIEAINVDVKLRLATEEISETILNLLLDATNTSMDPLATTRRTAGVSDVVVSPPMKRWQALKTLLLVYLDAFNNQLNDRYLAKVEEYKLLARNARETTLKFGIGLSSNPIPRAQTPVMSSTPGTNPDTTYYVQVSWVSASGQEGAPSEETAFETPAESTLVVSAVNPPSVATGFNVYLGLTSGSVTLQTSSPIPVGQSFTLPSPELVAGARAGMGQTADTYVVSGPMLRRG